MLHQAPGFIGLKWYLLANVPSEVSAEQIALWYYWRWEIESFFKLVKSGGQQLEHWQQESGLAVLKRLLVASMACAVVWWLQRDESPESEEFKSVRGASNFFGNIV